MTFGTLLNYSSAALIVASLAGCAGTYSSSFNHDSSYQINQPVKSKDCYDASVLLNKSLTEAKAISKKVLVAVDARISEETDTSLKAQRNRHIGVFVGSGGEELTVELNPVTNERTFVTTTTKTGFVGGAGQKAWSCQIIDQLTALAAK